MKKHFILSLMLALGCLSQVMAAPGRPLLDMFTRMFPDAEYVTWTNDHGYHVVSFAQGETSSRIWFNDQGALVYSLKYCPEINLPMKITSALKKKYSSQQIYGFTEVTNKTGIRYEVMLQDNRKWYRVSVSELGDVSLQYTMRK
jgi:hypothetical protein